MDLQVRCASPFVRRAILETGSTRWSNQRYAYPVLHNRQRIADYSSPPDGWSDFFTFSTGRRAVSSLHTVAKLRPRHDLLQYAYQIIRSTAELDLTYVDELELDLTFQDGANIPDTVWAIVAKSEMKNIKDSRWDLVSGMLCVCGVGLLRGANL